MEHAATQHRRFHLRELIGAGAFGEVYLAEQDSGSGFRRRVAVKILNGDAAVLADAGMRMRDEARILGRLHHRNIVIVLDLVRLGERWAVVMDYVDGCDLDHLGRALREVGESFPATAALEIGADVAGALDAAQHAVADDGSPMEVIHRDIKPANIRLTPHGDVKVLDFGVARVNLAEREAATRTGGWIGTERYMSPERILLEGDSHAGDVYSTAATVAELILGQPIGRTPVLEDRHQRWVDDILEQLRPHLKGPDDTVEAILEQLGAALAAQPSARPTAGVLSDALRDLGRRLEGPHLIAFARVAVPRVAEILGEERASASGVLSERSFTLAPDASAGTFVDFADEPSAAPPPPAPVAVPEPAPSRGGGAILGLLGLGVVAVAAFVLTRGPAEPETGPTVIPLNPDAADIVEDPLLELPIEEEPVEAVEEADVTPKATPRPAPRPAAPVVEEEEDEEDPSGPFKRARVARATFEVQDAQALEVKCGTLAGEGTSRVVLEDLPNPRCRITVTIDGQTLTTRETVEDGQSLRCFPSDGTKLVCEH